MHDFFFQAAANAPAMGGVLLFLNYRIKKLEIKVEKHNKFGERVAVLETKTRMEESG